MPAQTSVKSEMNTVQYHPLCPNIVTAVLLLYILWTGFCFPDLCLSMCKEFIVHGTIPYVVCQNIVITKATSYAVRKCYQKTAFLMWDQKSASYAIRKGLF